jgi:hypothetical protein
VRYSRLATLLLVPVLLVGLAAPSVASDTQQVRSPRYERTDFQGQYFPEGMDGTETTCRYTWMPPSFCIIDPGEQTTLPSGKTRIRGMTLFELAFAFDDDGQPEPRKTGYDIVTADAILDESLSGPTWGTWKLHRFEDDVLMFEGFFVGKFKDGIPAVMFVGSGAGEYERQSMRGHVTRELDEHGFNMYGRIVARNPMR